MKIDTPLWQPISEWHEDDGSCFLTRFPVHEPYGCGSPLDTDWDGYYTHFIPMSILNPLLNDNCGAVQQYLRLQVTGEYFHQMKSGKKTEEYRLYNDFWKKRLLGEKFETISISLGYPKKADREKFLEFPWRGYEVKTITHPHFGPDPVKVFAIKLAWKWGEKCV